MAQLIVRIPVSQINPPEGYFVATNGRWGASGTIFDPWSMDYAISASSPLTDDDQLWMRGGTYNPLTAGVIGTTNVNGIAGVAGKGCYRTLINGSSGHPIKINNYPGERVRINGGIHFTGGDCSYITFSGIEVGATPTTRVFAAAADVDFPGMYISAPGISLRNCYIHDMTCVYPMEAAGFEMNGCVVGWCGWYITYNTGYNLYAHNLGGGAVDIQRNVFLYSMSAAGSQDFYNLHFYGVAGEIRDYNFQYNTVVYGKTYVGTTNTENSGNVFNNNFTMGGRSGFHAQTGTGNANPTDIEIKYNYIWDRVGGYCLYHIGYKSFDIQHNLVVNSGAGTDEWGYYTPNDTPVSEVRDYNEYWGNNNVGSFVGDGVSYNFADWKTNTGFDLNSTQQLGTGVPDYNVVGITPCSYGKRGIVSVQNYLASASISADLSTFGFDHGAGCRYYNCLNMDEYVDFTYDADNPTITIPMGAAVWSLREPTAYDSVTVWPTEPFPAYGAFLVEQR